MSVQADDNLGQIWGSYAGTRNSAKELARKVTPTYNQVRTYSHAIWSPDGCKGSKATHPKDCDAADNCGVLG